ncbi:MAG: dihydroorotate dehydrogenase [Patescibacteria group bacterium]
MALETFVAGVQLAHPIMNAAGTCRTVEDVRELLQTPVAAVMVGSITMEPRTGNTGQTFWNGPNYSVNSLGLPNGGMPYYKDALPEMVRLVHGANTPIFASVVGFTPQEYRELAAFVLGCGVDRVELNLGCPNIWRGGVQKEIPCFNDMAVADILAAVEHAIDDMVKVIVKLSPFSDLHNLEQVAAMLKRFSIVRAVTSCNTKPNVCEYDENGKPLIGAYDAVGGHIISGGLSGQRLKPISLPQVKTLRCALPSYIKIIGVGGINSGQDVLDYIQAGAVVVQVGTALLQRGHGVFSQLLAEYIELAGPQKGFDWNAYRA